jgi:hypothetical protein
MLNANSYLQLPQAKLELMTNRLRDTCDKAVNKYQAPSGSFPEALQNNDWSEEGFVYFPFHISECIAQRLYRWYTDHPDDPSLDMVFGLKTVKGFVARYNFGATTNPDYPFYLQACIEAIIKTVYKPEVFIGVPMKAGAFGYNIVNHTAITPAYQHASLFLLQRQIPPQAVNYLIEYARRWQFYYHSSPVGFMTAIIDTGLKHFKSRYTASGLDSYTNASTPSLEMQHHSVQSNLHYVDMFGAFKMVALETHANLRIVRKMLTIKQYEKYKAAARALGLQC